MKTLAPHRAGPPESRSSPTAGTATPASLLRERSRWHRFGASLICVNAGLLLTLALLWLLHPSRARVDSPGRLPLAWGGGLGATLLLAGVVWVARRRSTSLHGARRLDTSLQSMNRLEAVALLESQVHPIARAQREETAAFLADRSSARSRPNYLKILLLVAIALVVAHLATLALWTQPWLRAQAAPVKAAPTPPPTALPRATIIWKSPKSEITASSVEEVPLEVVADSETGLNGVVLEAAVNGEVRPGTPIPADALTKPGAHPLQTSLYLDQLKVEPYDILSYYLRANRVAKGNLPGIVSPVQFIEVKPFRDDVRELPPADGASKALFDLLTALKVSQLNLLKQNFVLGHAEINHESSSWKKENARVGDEQTALGAKADEIIAQGIQQGWPATIVDLLQQARALMPDAAGKIRDAKNVDALPMQGKSLGLITEIEKYFIKAAAKSGKGQGGAKNVKDPFEKQKEFELKQRFETVAGGLEALAREQLKLAQELAKADPKDPNAGHPTPEPPGAEPKRPDPNRIEGTFTERQTLIAQRIGALLNQQVLPPEVNAHLEAAQGHARESLRQLDADDLVQSREPAAAAARELRLASQTVDRLGQDHANDKLADALNRLNQAADEARSAARAKSDAEAKQAADAAAAAAADTRDKLVGAARQEQETGSAQAAAKLADAVHALDDPKLRDALKQLHDQPHNQALANTAADALARAAEQVAEKGGQRSSDEIAKLVERVERTRRNFERLAQAHAGSPADAPHGDAGNLPAPDGHSPDGAQLNKDATSPGKAGDGQPSPQGNEPAKDSTAAGKEGLNKVSEKPDGNGKARGDKAGLGRTGQEKSGSGKTPPAKGGKDQTEGHGKEGQGQGPGQKGKDAGQGQGTESHGQGEAGQGKGQGKGNGQERSPGDQDQGQGSGEGQGTGDGESESDSATAGDPFPGVSGQGGGGTGGHGSGRGSAKASAEPSSNHRDGPSASAAYSSASPSKDKAATNANGSGDGGQHPSDDGRNPSTERVAQELMADLRAESLEARTILVNPDGKAVLDELRPDIHGVQPRNNISVVASFERIRAPMDRLITLLRAELDRSQRQHELTDQTQEKAPPAYGEAVADYFEQLSRDYQPASTPAAAPAPEPATTPAP